MYKTEDGYVIVEAQAFGKAFYQGAWRDATQEEIDYWEKFGRPSSLKEYGKNAIKIAKDLYASDYQLMEGNNIVYYDDDGSGDLTLNDVGNVPAILDASNVDLFDRSYPVVESVFAYTENVVLKGIGELVSCGGINKQSVIDTAEADINSKRVKLEQAIALIDNHDETKDIAVFNLIKDMDLTGANLDAISTAIAGV